MFHPLSTHLKKGVSGLPNDNEEINPPFDKIDDLSTPTDVLVVPEPWTSFSVYINKA